MSNLKVKPNERLINSQLSHPVMESTTALRNYLTRGEDVTCAPFWTGGGLSYERTEQLPAIFRSNRTVSSNEPRTNFRYEGASASAAEPSKSDRLSVIFRLSPYLVVAIVLSLVAGEAVLVATTAPQGGRVALEPLQADKVAVASVFSAETIEIAQPEPALVTPASMASGERWSDTVATFKRLLAEQKAVQAPSIRQAENGRLLEQMEAWLKAKSR
ncbi:MAG: hypothetical protein WBX25_11115 [Rhodomicrobium sp.]